MFHPIVTFLLCLTITTRISSENLNGIFIVDSCECNSPNEKCEPNGPFIFDQQRSTVAVRYGSTQVGVGTLGNNRLDLYLNQNRCKGLWNRKNRLAELKCQHQDGIVCATNLRCVAGACLDDTPINVSSATITNISVGSILSLLLILIFEK
jgi:hypothetical protein